LALGNSSFVVSENGHVYSFGFNGNGILGLGNKLPTSKPTRIDVLDRVDRLISSTRVILKNGELVETFIICAAKKPGVA
jgi:alpha-tubulin suppressor-like RCC1 family protein